MGKRKQIVGLKYMSMLKFEAKRKIEKIKSTKKRRKLLLTHSSHRNLVLGPGACAVVCVQRVNLRMCKFQEHVPQPCFNKS